MKELSIEQKAKLYDEAIAKGKKIQNTPYTAHWDTMKEVVEHLFPELTESEDEKIRKWIYGIIKNICWSADENAEKELEIMQPLALAWLEKQVEHSNFLQKIQVGDQVTRNEDGVLVNLSQLKRVAKTADETKKQGEQKPIIPKFREGDIIKRKDTDETFEVSKIEVIDEDEIYYHLTNGGCVCENSDNFERVEQKPVIPKFRVGDTIKSKPNLGLEDTLFVIDKIKDGAYWDGDNSILICNQDDFEVLQTPLFRIGDIIKNKKTGDEVKINGIHLKEQSYDYQGWDGAATIHSDFAFSKQYEWELIEQKPVEDDIFEKWTDEEEYNIRELEGLVRDRWAKAEREKDDLCIKKMSNLSFFLKTIKKQKQKPVEWNEEDSNIWNRTLLYLENMKDSCATSCVPYINECINWLKSLKERCQSQPKQEWSEEDERHINDIMWCIEAYKNNAFNKTHIDIANRAEGWLKSLHLKNHWKPSEEQMKALKEASDKDWDIDGNSPLYTLYEQLKAL